MDRLNLAAGERYDAVHNTILLDGVEALARKNNLAVLRNGHGLIRLPSSITYDAGTQKFTIPSGTVMMDAAGNIAELSSSLQTGSVPPAMVGSTLFLWAAIQPGKTPTNALVRVKNTGSGVVSFSTNTAKVDAVSVQAVIASPSDLTNPTAVHFPIATVTWVGIVPTATPTSPLALGNSGVPGSVLDALQDLAAEIKSVKGTADWFTTGSSDVEILNGYVTNLRTTVRQIPLTSGGVESGTVTPTPSDDGLRLVSGNGISWTYRIPIDVSSGLRLQNVTARALVATNSTLTAKVSTFESDGTEAILGTVTWAPGGGYSTETVYSGTHSVDLSTYRYELIFSGSNGADAVHHIINRSYMSQLLV